jgi:hypothetical protein
MAVIRKPTPNATPVDVEALIAKGGSVPQTLQTPPVNDPPKAVLLHVPAAMLARVDQALQAQPIKIPRKTWILQAMQEKLARDIGAE